MQREYAHTTQTGAVGGIRMRRSRSKLRQGLVVCLLIITGFGGLFALALLVGAVTGKGFAASILLGGFGLFLLLLFVLAFVFGVMYWKSLKSS